MDFAPLTQFGFGPSQAAGGEGGKTMRDVTIRQLIRECSNSSNEEGLKVDGADLTTFFVVGRITSRDDSGAALKLKVDDGTGCIDVLHYPDPSPEAKLEAQEWVEDSYVRVAGALKPSGGQRTMQSFRIRAIKDFNEVTHHNLHCILQHLHFSKGAAPPPGSAPPSALGKAIKQEGNHASAPAGASTGPAGQLKETVMAVYEEHRHVESGISMDDVVATLSSRGVACSRAQLQELVTEFTNDGLIYSTDSLDQVHRVV